MKIFVEFNDPSGDTLYVRADTITGWGLAGRDTRGGQARAPGRLVRVDRGAEGSTLVTGTLAQVTATIREAFGIEAEV